MKRSLFSLFLLLALSSLPLRALPHEPSDGGKRSAVDPPALDRRLHRGREGWERIIPTHLKVQYAGSMGLLSAGFGWDYGRKCRWETDLLVGYVPRYTSDRGHATLTLKQNYIPWSLYASDSFSFDPIYGGIYLNTIFGQEFWGRQPSRYPRGYYWFSTKLRTHIFWGCRATWHPNARRDYWVKGVTLFFEVNTCDLYIVRAVGNEYLHPHDIIGFSVGLKLQIF